MEIVTIKSMTSLMVGGFVINTHHDIRQYYEFSKVFVTREEDEIGNGYLLLMDIM